MSEQRHEILSIAGRCALLATLVAIVWASGYRAAAQDGDGVSGLLEQIGDRVLSYYERLTTIICTETVMQQELKSNFAPRGKPREFLYDLIVTREPGAAGASDPQVRAERQIKAIDGRPAKAGDEPACTDPAPMYGEPLVFLLPAKRVRYRFARASRSNPASTVLEFAEVAAEPTSVSWKANCFTADGGRTTGKVILDASTGDVMQLETKLAEPFQVSSPAGAAFGQRTFVIERSDTTVRFKRVAFENPDETLLLPESIVTVTSVRGAATPRVKTTQSFSGFHRFLTEVKVR